MFLQPSKISLVHVWQQTQMLKNILEMGFHNEASQFITQHGSDAVKPRRFGPELHIFIKEKTKMNWSTMGHFHLQYERFFLASLWACCSEKQKFWHKLGSVSCTRIKKNQLTVLCIAFE